VGVCADPQEAKRIFNVVTTWGLTVSMISVVLGIIPLYKYSLQTGGECLPSPYPTGFV
jgi:hypothetical protein